MFLKRLPWLFWLLGFSSRAETPVVDLPWPCGQSFVVSQAHHGSTHQGDDAYAWDFRMPEGTPVLASLSGTVRRVRGDSQRGGCDPLFSQDANYVVVAHEHRLETLYLHLSRVVVAVGQHVKKGQLLGYSGRTGFACGSHLHFKVANAASETWNNPSVEAQLRGHKHARAGHWLASPQCAVKK